MMVCSSGSLGEAELGLDADDGSQLADRDLA